MSSMNLERHIICGNEAAPLDGPPRMPNGSDYVEQTIGPIIPKLSEPRHTLIDALDELKTVNWNEWTEFQAPELDAVCVKLGIEGNLLRQMAQAQLALSKMTPSTHTLVHYGAALNIIGDKTGKFLQLKKAQEDREMRKA